MRDLRHECIIALGILLISLNQHRFSGVSWTWSGNLNYTDQVSHWDASGRDHDSDKVPSRIAYDANGNVKTWGYMTNSSNKYHAQWFKLLLSEEAGQKGGPKVKEVKELLKTLNKKPVDIVADYLKKLWRHSLKEIELKLTKQALDNMQLRVVITVPAQWDHAGEELTRQAAIQAGITTPRFAGRTTLKLVSEPEAAALAAWKEAGLQLRPDLSVTIFPNPAKCFELTQHSPAIHLLSATQEAALWT